MPDVATKKFQMIDVADGFWSAKISLVIARMMILRGLNLVQTLVQLVGCAWRGLWLSGVK
jgi:hypothetical protein